MKPSYKRRATESHRAYLQIGSLTVLHFTVTGLIQVKLSLAGQLLLPSNSFQESEPKYASSAKQLSRYKIRLTTELLPANLIARRLRSIQSCTRFWT